MDGSIQKNVVYLNQIHLKQGRRNQKLKKIYITALVIIMIMKEESAE